ncbi:hypothetical protein, partial [Acidiphilium sp.]|uniref:hypothetical protein n=1 Tax=Acidiphilium sp. TaxID=527 RepID=UPI003D006D44
ITNFRYVLGSRGIHAVLDSAGRLQLTGPVADLPPGDTAWLERHEAAVEAMLRLAAPPPPQK